jgi:hypothetical protein
VPDSIPPCPPWCTQPASHDGNHTRLIGSVEPTPFDNTVQEILVTVEAAAGKTEPLPVVTLVTDGNVTRLSARMTWREAGELCGLVDVAALRAGRDPLRDDG